MAHEIRMLDVKVVKLKNEFHSMILENLKKAKRLDLISGYALSAVDEYDRKFGVRGYELTTLPDEKISISKKFRINTNGDEVEYYHNMTEQSKIMTEAYNKYVIRDKRMPKINWRTEMHPYVSQEYLDEVEKMEKSVLASKNPWDMCIIASNIPYSNVRRLENAVIKQKNPLAVLEFASSVRGADLLKLRDAISTMKDKEELISGEKADYVAIFNERFGLPNDEQYQPE